MAHAGMRLPWVQVSVEVIEQSAPDISVELDADEAAIGWGLVKLFQWALGRCPDHLPPSHSDVVKGTHAAKLISRAACWRGDPDAFVAACLSGPYPLLERVDGGIRIRGMDRYDQAWKKNHREAWEALQSTSRPEPARKPAGTRTETALKTGDSDPQDQDQDQDEEEVVVGLGSEAKFQNFSPPPPPDQPPPTAPLPDSEGKPAAHWEGDRIRWEPTVEGGWEFIQLVRVYNDLPREATRPKGFAAFMNRCLAEVGQSGFHEVLVDYVGDKTIRTQGHPTAVLMKCWYVRKPHSPEASP